LNLLPFTLSDRLLTAVAKGSSDSFDRCAISGQVGCHRFTETAESSLLDPSTAARSQGKPEVYR